MGVTQSQWRRLPAPVERQAIFVVMKQALTQEVRMTRQYLSRVAWLNMFQLRMLLVLG